MAADGPRPDARTRPAVLALRILLVRLRFLAVPVVAFLLVASWPVLQNGWETVTRHRHGPEPGSDAVSQDTEYFCPMCPGVVSEWPGKCPVCNMALVRRKRGEAVPLPDGVVARMQLSPYRVQLAGIQTSPVEYRPLAREAEACGFVEADGCVRPEVFTKDLPLFREGAAAEVTCEAFSGRPPFAGKVTKVGAETSGARPVLRACVEVADRGRELRPGMLVTVRVRLPVRQTEPFRSGPTDTPPGQVLAVPETAVVDTGSKKVVYVEQMPGMYDGVEVVLGPRCGDAYPVVRGLEAGQRVVTAGAFLLDAETRLNPSVAAGYFGAGRGAAPEPRPSPSPAPAVSPEDKIARALERLAPAERELARRQKVCPVTGKPLGSMGTPPSVVVEGRTVFLCCQGCEAEFREDPAKYLAKLQGK